jgi:ribosomal protein S18 acetylase RimI-like enzyme
MPTNKSIKIRIGSKSDLINMKNIDQSLLVIIDEIHETRTEKAIKKALINKTILIAEIKNEVVGYLWYEFLWGYIPFISLIRINKSFHRNGIGKTLMKFLENKLNERKIERILSSTENENRSAIKFHKSLGYNECGYFKLAHWAPNKELFFEKMLNN